MPAITPSKILQMAQEHDPKQAIFNALGKALDTVAPRNNLVLVGTYIAPEKTRGGIIRPHRNVDEDLYMGIMGLVLKKGPTAFKDDERLNVFWDGQDVKVGDWALFRFSSAWEFHLNGVSVRMVEDREIKAVIDDPEVIVSRPSLVLG